MRPPDFNKTPQIKILSSIISIGLFLGVLITTLLWLEVPAQAISPLFLLILAAAGLSAFFILCQPSSRTRWPRLLAVTAAVSLVYLFPEMFRPVCGDTPRAFASPSTRCGRCVDFVCEWNYKKHKEWCYCNEWDTSGCTDTNPPTIQAALNCDQWGLDNWCVGSLFLDLSATEPQGREVLISGDVDGTVFACPSGTGSATCSIPLPEGAGIVSYTATSANGLTASGSNPYQRDSIQPQINGALSGTSGNNGWYISPVDVSASAADPAPGSGMAAFEYSLNSGNWETFIDPLNLVDGVHSLNLRATDVAGNLVETNQTIQVDTVTPALALSLNGTAGTNGWYISTVEVNATAGDDGSGLAVLETSVGGSPWSAFTTPLLFDNGGHSYQFRAIDHAGNLTETPLQGVSVDTIPPAIDLPSSWVLGQAIGFKLQDDGSGLAGFRVVIEDEDERFPKVTWDEGLSGNKFKDEIAWNGRFKDGSLAPPEGEYYAWLKVSDNAGNESMRAGQIFVEAVASSPVYLPSVPVHAPETPESVESGNAVPQTFFSPTVSVPPVASFGGGSNSVQSSPPQAGKVSFNSSASSSPPIANPQPGILWGASATAAIGAFAAEYVHRKEIEKAAMRARVAARQERRAASNAHQKIKAKKLKQLEAKWRQIEQAAQARKQAALDRRIDRNDMAVEIEMRSHLTRAKAQKDADARARQKAHDVYRAQEVAAHTKISQNEVKVAWWENTKTFVQEKIVSPINSGIYQPFVKPGLEKLSESVKNGTLWLNENLYQPYVKPALQEAGQKIADGFAWVNENVFQPHIKPILEKTIQVVSSGLAWVNEKIYEPYLKPVLEKAMNGIVAGVAWANENIYQPHIKPAWTSFIENIYQPHISPLVNRAKREWTDYRSWINETFYQPFIQPIMADLDQHIYQPHIKPVQDKATDWWEATWDKYGEWVHGALDAVGFIPGFGEVADGLNGLIYLGEGRYLEATVSALAMIPLIGDLGKGGKWAAELGGEIVEEAIEKVAKEATETVVKEVIEVGAEKVVKEVGEGVAEKVVKETVEETAEKMVHESGEGIIEKTAREIGEEVSEKILKETGEELVEKATKESVEELAEKTLREGNEKVLKQTSKESIENGIETTTKNISKNTSNEIAQQTTEKVVKLTKQEIKLAAKYGPNAIKLAEAVGINSAYKLCYTLKNDVIEYVIEQGPEAIDALSKWDLVDLLRHGPELAMRAKQDAIALEATSKLVDMLKNMDPDQVELLIDIMKTRGNKGLVQSVETEARQLLMDSDNFKKAKELIETIASNSTHYADGKQLGLGKWVDYGNGFTKFSRNTGSVHYNPHPEMWNLFEPLGMNREAAAWLINKQVVETGIVKGLPVEFALEGVPVDDILIEESAVEMIFSGATDSEIRSILEVNRIPVRWQELRELKNAGYVFTSDKVNKSFIFSLP